LEKIQFQENKHATHSQLDGTTQMHQNMRIVEVTQADDSYKLISKFKHVFILTQKSGCLLKINF